MNDWILFAISLPFVAAGALWQIIVRGFLAGRELMDRYITE